MAVENKIRTRLEDATTPEEFAKALHELGLELMDSGELDSDELIWEIAREMWKHQDTDFETSVYDEYEKLD